MCRFFSYGQWEYKEDRIADSSTEKEGDRCARPNRRKRPRSKQTKVQLRLRPEQKEVIAKAARLRQTTLSNFLLENAYSAAQQVLAEQVHFVLSPERWQTFCQAAGCPAAGDSRG